MLVRSTCSTLALHIYYIFTLLVPRTTLSKEPVIDLAHRYLNMDAVQAFDKVNLKILSIRHSSLEHLRLNPIQSNIYIYDIRQEHCHLILMTQNVPTIHFHHVCKEFAKAAATRNKIL